MTIRCLGAVAALVVAVVSHHSAQTGDPIPSFTVEATEARK